MGDSDLVYRRVKYTVDEECSKGSVFISERERACAFVYAMNYRIKKEEKTCPPREEYFFDEGILVVEKKFQGKGDIELLGKDTENLEKLAQRLNLPLPKKDSVS